MANLSRVTYYSSVRKLLHVPDAMLTYFCQVHLEWFGRLARFSPTLAREALAAIQKADWSHAVIRPDSAKRSYLPCN